MLKTIVKSSNKKLGGCAATYRSGRESVYGTCPVTCGLKPPNQEGSRTINREYLQAVIEGVPRNGVAWTYTHFGRSQVPMSSLGETCINISTDDVETAARSYLDFYPTVFVAPSWMVAKVDKLDVGGGTIRAVRCPAEYSDRTCNDCGGDVPLCARPNRDYIIKFTAHGSGAKKVDQRFGTVPITSSGVPEPGGCYGNGGPVRLQWEKTRTFGGSMENDADALTAFVSTLPPGTKLRHHVVGDLG